MLKMGLIWLIWASNLWQLGTSIWLNLPPSGTKCVSEEIQTNVVVLSDYYVISDDHTSHEPTITVKVFPAFELFVRSVYEFILVSISVDEL